jgi:hypothetical protein
MYVNKHSFRIIQLTQNYSIKTDLVTYILYGTNTKHGVIDRYILYVYSTCIFRHGLDSSKRIKFALCKLTGNIDLQSKHS